MLLLLTAAVFGGEASADVDETPLPDIYLLRATDTLGRDISGTGQVVKPSSQGEKPLLVQVLDVSGAPVRGMEVTFRLDPSTDASGEAIFNGGLFPMASAEGLPTGKPSPTAGQGAVAPVSEWTLKTDPRGFAGVYYQAGEQLEVVSISAALTASPAKAVHFRVRVINPQWGLLLWSGLLGGLALFLYGMRMSSKGLEQAAGYRLRHILSRVTDNRFLGLIVGILVTAMIQSSSATTVMVVSFTNAGLMTLGQTLAIILGADVGTTLTVQVIAFSFKEYSLVIVFIGFIISSFPKRRYRATGNCIMGFGLIFFGMAIMGNAMDPLRDHPFFRQILLASAHQPFLVFLVALLFTGLIQSSAATIGIALTFAFQGMIELSAAIPVIFGANIGTCVTAFLAAIGTRREAQRVAYAHILFKILTVLICWPFIGPFTELVRLTSRELPRQIANAHTIFNLAAALLFLPALSGAERFLRRLLPHRSEKDGARWSPKYLDERILETPTLALAQVTREISRMGDTVLLMLREGVTAISQRDEAKIHKVIALDDKVDTLDTALRRYLTRLSRFETTEMQAAKVASLLYLVHHLETIGDLISKNLMDVAKKVVQQQLRFSDAGSQQWQEFYNLNIKLLEKALAAFATNDKAMAQDVFKAKEEMSRMARNLHFLHLERLGRGIPETERTSDLHIHLISDLRRILSNTVSIAAAVVHEYRIPDLETDFILHQRGQ